MSKSKRGQYSVEFLVTYGWALLIITIVVGTIYTFGWFDPSNILPQECKFYGQIGCKDFYVSNKNMRLSLINNFGVDLKIKKMEVYSNGEFLCGEEYIGNEVGWAKGEFNYTEMEFDTLLCDGSTEFTQNIIPNERAQIITTIKYFYEDTCSGCNGNPIGMPSCPEECIHSSSGKIQVKIDEE